MKYFDNYNPTHIVFDEERIAQLKSHDMVAICEPKDVTLNAARRVLHASL